MISASLNFRILHIFFLIFLLGSFSGCNGDHAPFQKKEYMLQVANDKKMSDAHLFLTYIDSVAKLPLTKFSEANLIILNKKFSEYLPLVMHNLSKDDNGKNIVIQLYHKSDSTNTIQAGAIFLVPKHITDSLHIADFTRYFGSIKKEKPLIGITEQPLPVQITISASTAIKLTFNDHEKIEQSKVIMVEVLKYN
ncbi:hypothetical protein [Pedobacter sp. N23S346]|uniref:hypothetical protein n=1 Tax=Pedobacter sp. N23S346 TaxID=3402750 RepID=UPI003AC0D398